MKTNKKLIVSSLASVMAISMVGSIAGTVAWYQFNTRVTTSLIGTNVAETGVLEVSATSASAGFTRDLIAADLLNGRTNGSKVTPVTFGKLGAQDALPAQAYKNPRADANMDATNPGSYAEVYELADKNHDYIQYDVWFRARDVENVSGGFEQVEKDVFLSDIVLEDENHAIEGALRVHLAIDENGDSTVDRNLLFAKSAVNGLQLYGVLDCDDDGKADIKGGYQWNEHRNDLVYYGNAGDYQNAVAMNDLKATKTGTEINPVSDANIGKKIFTTPTTGATKVTVTIWLEGWDNSVAEETITRAVAENQYAQIESIKAEDLTGKGLFTKSGDPAVYAAATGLAVTGTTYYAVSFEEIHLDKGVVIPANTYRASRDATAAYVAAGTVSENNGVDYYIAHDKAATVRYAEADTSAYFTESAGVYSAASGAAASGTTYYQKLATAAGTVSVAASVATGAQSVEGLYTRSGEAGNYVFTEAHGRNVTGTDYYTLDEVNFQHVPMWSGEDTDGVEFKFGMTFDVGTNAFRA